MPSDDQFDGLFTFDGGLVISRNPVDLQKNEASLLRNVDFGKTRSLRRRNGVTTHSTCASLTGFEGALPFPYTTAAGVKFLVAFGGGKMYTCTLPGTTWTQRATGFTTGKKWGGAVFQGILYYGNGVDAIHTWDGTSDAVLADTSGGTVPKGNVFIEYEFRLCVTGNATAPYFLYTSDAGDATKWNTSTTTATETIIGANDSYGNIGLVKQQNVLIVIRETGDLYSVTFDALNVQTVTAMGVNMPAIAKYGVVKTENDFYTIGSKGVYSFGQQANYALGARAGEISSNISPFFDPALPNQEYDYYLTSLANAAGVYFRGNLIYAVQDSGSSANSRCIVYHPSESGTSPWCEWTNLAFSAFTYDVGTDTLYTYSSTDNKVKTFNTTYNDDNAAIDFDYKSGKLAFTPFVRSSMRWVVIDSAKATGFTGILVVYLDDESSGHSFIFRSSGGSDGVASGPLGQDITGQDIVGDSTAGSTTGNVTDQIRIPMLLPGVFTRVRIRSNQVNERVEVYRLGFIKKTRKTRSYQYDKPPT